MQRVFCYQEELNNDLYNLENALLTHAMIDFCDGVTNLGSIASLYDADFKSLYEVPKDYRLIPLGTLPFVQKVLSIQKGTEVTLHPICVPEVLRKYLHREYRLEKGNDLTMKEAFSRNYFLRDASVLEEWDDPFKRKYNSGVYLRSDHLYVVTEAVVFDSEWRLFVYQDEILGAECYRGNPGIFPFRYTVQNMVADYAKTIHPEAYTLDVGIRWFTPKEQGYFQAPPSEITEPIAVQPFVANGLYGFYRKELFDMFEAGYRWYVEHNLPSEK